MYTEPRRTRQIVIAISHNKPRQYRPTLIPGGRRQARRYRRCNAVVNEMAKKIVSTSPRKLVACRTSSAEANASLARVSASPRTPNMTVTLVTTAARAPGGRYAATTIRSGKKAAKPLPAERDAAIDELDLEHAFPHTPKQRLLQPIPKAGHQGLHQLVLWSPIIGRRQPGVVTQRE